MTFEKTKSSKTDFVKRPNIFIGLIKEEVQAMGDTCLLMQKENTADFFTDLHITAVNTSHLLKELVAFMKPQFS
jgi:hypothetical protein